MKCMCLVHGLTRKVVRISEKGGSEMKGYG